MDEVVKDRRHALDLLRGAAVFQPSIVPGLGLGGFYVFSGPDVLGHGATIHDAMVAAGYWPPVKGSIPVFVRDGLAIRRGSEVVAEAKTSTMARRIANALNEYIPGDRGF
jgi:hypothetical protein